MKGQRIAGVVFRMEVQLGRAVWILTALLLAAFCLATNLYAGELTVTTESGTTIVVNDGARKWKFLDDMVWGPKEWYHTSVDEGAYSIISEASDYPFLWGIATRGLSTDSPVLLESSPTRARVMIKDGSNYTITTVYPTGKLYQDYSVNYASQYQQYGVHSNTLAPQVHDSDCPDPPDDCNNTVVISDTTNDYYAGISMIPYTPDMGVTAAVNWYFNLSADESIYYKIAALNGSGQILFDASNYRATTATRDNARDDYRRPEILTNLNTGSGGWFDSSENTQSLDDFFNEVEGAYAINMADSQRLVFDIAGDYSFSDGFENGLAPPWSTIYEATTGDSVTQSTFVRTGGGTYSAQCTTDTEYPAQACVVKELRSSSTLWVKWYIYLESGFPASGHVDIMNTVNLKPSWKNILSLNIYPDMRLYVSNFGGASADYYFSTNTITTGAWHYIEAKFVISPTAGEAKVWVDSSLWIDQTSIDTGSRNLDQVQVGIFWQGETEAVSLYIDDVVIEGPGAQANRYSPAFKIRNYRSLSDPQSVYKNTTALVNGTDYNADVMPISEAWYYNGSSYTQLAAGGLISSGSEYLARSDNNSTLNFSTSGHYLYLGSTSKFQGINIDLATLGSGSSPTIQWQYWNGAWTNLSVSETASGAKNFLADGCVYFTQPGDWAKTTVNGGTSLYYVRANLSSGSYSTPPIENLIKTDILLFQLLGNITESSATISFIGPTAVDLVSFEAKQYDDLVLLEWRTAREVRNLGFNVYREEDGELSRLNPELIAGSAFLVGSGTPLTAGHHYVWWDTAALSDQQSAVSGQQSGVRSQRSAVGDQRSSLRYWLEDVDLNGKRTRHGPVTPVLSHKPLPPKLRPELLSEFGMRLQERYADFWKAQALREKLKATHDRGASRLRRDSRSGLSGLEDRPSALRQKNFGLLTSSEAILKRSAPRGNLVPDPRANAVQRSLAGRPAMKLLVKEEGWYRVSQAELAAAGMNTNFNPKHLHLYADGNELPIRVIAEKEGRLGPKDAIEFYGIGLDTPSTDARVYWLVVGSKPGKRINSHISSPQFRNPQSEIRNAFESSLFRNPHSAIRNSFESFPSTAESKERSFYFPALLNGEESNFFGSIIYTYRVDQLLYVWDADPTSPEDALLEVALQGATSGPHRVKVFFNDAEVGEVSFSGQSQARFLAGIPVSVLQAGENLVSFIAQGGEMDISLLDSIHLTYWRAYRAHENALKLTAQGGRQVSVGGFSHAQIRVMDVTNPLEAVEVEGKVKAQGSGYAITFRAPGSGPRTLLAIGVEKAKSPAQLVLNQPSNWNQRGNGYDLVIISHKDFLEILKPLKTLRENQGLSVALVDVEDVYDEFSFGSKTPRAIKDFLQRAKSNWQKAPRFVLLVGDASYDPRNFQGFGELDFVPTKLLDTEYLETASDDWFVDFDEDGQPEMALGRLPVQTPEEASAVVAKIIAYEKSTGTNEALLVADKMEMTDGFDFAAAARKLKALFPSSIGVKEVFRGDYSNDSQVREVLLGYLSKGSLLVNYLGHGGMGEWRGLIFTSQDADGLPNGMRLPFFVNMTCLNGFFQAPYGDSIAEVLLKAEQGGAVAVWTSSGMTFPAGQAAMNQELIKLLFNGEGLTIGEAAVKAKKAVNDKDIRRTWILFGDPSTRLKP